MPDLNRLALVIAMFDSPSEGERSAAFARADAIIRKAGALWADVLPGLYAVGGGAMQLSGVDGGHVDRCREMLRHSRDLLTDWEHGFLMNVIGRARLTGPQFRRLEELMTEIKVRRSAQAEFGEAPA